jgi:hypothetical protein
MTTTPTQILNQKWITYARDHGFDAYVKSGWGRSEELGIILEIPWYKPGTTETGIDYIHCVSGADVRAALGY